jgi:hypothetical protein
MRPPESARDRALVTLVGFVCFFGLGLFAGWALRVWVHRA